MVGSLDRAAEVVRRAADDFVAARYGVQLRGFGVAGDIA
jgi:hypothetical protein